MLPPPPTSTLFPYTTLFRSARGCRSRRGAPPPARRSRCRRRRPPRCRAPRRATPAPADRKSTRLNSSHVEISYAVFCLKKKKKQALTLASLFVLGFESFIVV